MEELLIQAAANIGVPAIIAFYVLFRVNHNLEELTKAVNQLQISIENIRYSL